MEINRKAIGAFALSAASFPFWEIWDAGYPLQPGLGQQPFCD